MDPWNNTLDKTINNIGSFIQVCQNLFDENEMNELDQTFRDIVKGFCVVDIEHQATIESLNKTKQYYEDKNNDMDVPVEECYENIYKNSLKMDLDEIEKHSLWVKYRSNFEENLDEENEEIVDENSGLISKDVFVPPTDPISKTLIRNPVRNSKCGHIYEKDTILVIIQQSNTRCPYIGCPNKYHINHTNLVEDDKLKRQIERYLLKKK